MLHSKYSKVSEEISLEAFLNDGRALIVNISILNSHGEDVSDPEHQIAVSNHEAWIRSWDLKLLQHFLSFLRSSIQVNIFNCLCDALNLADALIPTTGVAFRDLIDVIVEQSVVLDGSDHT